MSNLVQNFEHLVVFVHPRGLFASHLIYCAAERPNVCKPVVTRLLDNFGGHPVRCATKAFRLRIVGLDDLFRASKVRQLTASIVSNQDIGCFDISVHYVIVM